ncbi:MAG TPA: nuclear transport factor 2 family protein [Rugosimonospora sp.]|nr:nuclear transport factor 2 family protein [Rugosimonospora sp.]
MNRRLKHVVMFTTFSAACAIVPCLPRLLASPTALQESSQAPQGQKDFQQRALTAERAFVEAAAKSDPAALDQLLDVRFTWTDASGKTLTRQEVLQQAPKPAITDADAQFTAHNYGSLESIQIHSGKDHALHVWVNRPAGWRLLLYQEVRLLDAPPEAAPRTRAACENPCKDMPFEPKTQNERDVIAGFMALQTYTVAHDAKNWGMYVAEEFEAANSNSDQTLTKRGRMEDLARSKMAGYAPMPVVEMRVLDFGTAAILISKHQPEHAQPVHITRIWIKRGGHWMEAASYQTRIEDTAAR